MADKSLGGGALPFNIPPGIDAIKARDERFWQAHGAWRAAEAEFETWPGFPDQCETARRLLVKADAARTAMFATPVRTAIALQMKIEAARGENGQWGCIGHEARAGFSVGDMIQFDVERLAKFEMWGPDAFQDMAEG